MRTAIALIVLLFAAPVMAQDIVICSGTLTWPSGRSSDYEFRLVFSGWDGKLIVEGYAESFQFLNDGSATVHAVTGEVFVSPKNKSGVPQKNWSSGLKGFAMVGSRDFFTTVLFGGGDGYPGGSALYPYTLVNNGPKSLVLGTLDKGSKAVQKGKGTCR